MCIRLAGVVATVRLIGPNHYGIYAAAAAFTLVVATIAQMGAEVYLIRMPEEPSPEHYNQVFTYLIGTSLVTTAVALGATFAFGGLLRPFGVLVPLRILLLSVPDQRLMGSRPGAHRAVVRLSEDGDPGGGR